MSKGYVERGYDAVFGESQKKKELSDERKKEAALKSQHEKQIAVAESGATENGFVKASLLASAVAGMSVGASAKTKTNQAIGASNVRVAGHVRKNGQVVKSYSRRLNRTSA